VRTSAVDAFSEVAIVTEHLEAGRKVIPHEPSIERVAAAYLFAVLIAAASYVIDA
jgi:hypothetical protein